MYFDGNTYSHERDSARLGEQMMAVLSVMADGKWRTLAAIASETNAPEASVSARLRDIAILRALGATRGKILAVICLEAGLIGRIPLEGLQGFAHRKQAG